MAVLIVAVFLLGLPLTAELGAWMHTLLSRKSESDPSGAGFLSASALGLLSLLISFTFSMAVQRFEARRDLVVAEANAISTTYLRAQMLGGPSDGRLDALLARYARARLSFFDAGDDPIRLRTASRVTSELQNAIWRETGEALHRPGNGAFATTILNTTNDMFDLSATREAAIEATVPESILWAVTACAFATAALCGYGLAAGAHRHRVASTSLFVLVAIVLLLIYDVNTPRGGLIAAPQAPMVRQAADLADRERQRLAAASPPADMASVGAKP